MTLTTFLQPGWFAVLLAWNFAVLSAAQLTIRLIMAFSVRLTFLAAVALTAVALLIAAIYDLCLGAQPSLAARLTWAPLPMVLMGLSGVAIARWLLHVRRFRGQVIAGLMVGLLDAHVFTILAS